MSQIEDLRYEISRTINTLRRRYANTADEAERKTLLDAIASLNGKLSILNQASLLQAAQTLTDATEDVKAVIAAARMGPFDGYLAAIETHLNRLYSLSGEMHAFEGLPPAQEEAPAVGEPAAPAGGRPRSPIRALQPPLASTDFNQLKDEYQAWYDACEVRRAQQDNVDYYLKRMNQGQPTYAQVGEDLNGIPWYFIGIIHGMECGFNFNGHLHNGDPLTARTVHVPAGRPPGGSPPFTWRQSASDALIMKGFHEISDWSVPRMLYLLEKYNGFGYRRRRVATPYLWSFSNLYSKGKFVRDGSYDPDAVSKQCGAALMLKAALNSSGHGIPRQASRSRGAGRSRSSRKTADRAMKKA
jgi:lysozyme family protein